jgi:hypothetical protein
VRGRLDGGPLGLRYHLVDAFRKVAAIQMRREYWCCTGSWMRWRRRRRLGGFKSFRRGNLLSVPAPS